MSAPAADIDVYPSGSPTLQAAADAAKPGDNVVLHNGTYAPFTVRNSGASGAPITIRAAAGELPVVRGVSGTAQHNILLQASAGSTQPIGWLVFDGIESASATIDAMKAYNVHHLTLRHCHLHHSASQGLLVVGSQQVLIDSNLFNDNNPDSAYTNQDHGIYATGNDWTVVNNVFLRCRSYGIQIAGYVSTSVIDMQPGYDRAARWVVANNTFALGHDRGGIVVYDGDGGSCNDVLIENNIFFHNAESPGAVSSGSVNGLELLGAVTNVTIRNNDGYGSSPFFVASSGAGYSRDATMNADPRFADVANGNFHLISGSPCIDAGVLDRAPTTDADGRTRPLGAAIDCGAYEFLSEASSGTASAGSTAGSTGGSTADPAAGGPRQGCGIGGSLATLALALVCILRATTHRVRSAPR
nr:right-handed parallel beta-helix repeat-containing protein [Planctomycetota bacterium]